MKKTAITLLVVSAITLLSSCKTTQEDASSQREGILTISLLADTTSQTIQAGRATADAVPSKAYDPTLLDDYTVDIYKDGQLYKNYPRFADMPLSLTLPEGNYKICAAKGELLPAAWESPHYAGSRDQISIREGKPVNATVTVTQANARVTVSFNEEGFPLLYDSYDAVLSTEHMGNDSLIYGSDETRAAHFMAEEEGTPLNITLRVTRKGSGIAYRIVPEELPRIKPRHDMHITFNTDDASVTGVGSITVQVDNTVTEIPMTISVPGTMLPKPAPEITASGFTSGNVETLTEGNTLDMATAVITARGRIKRCILTMPTNLGLKSEYDLAALSAADSAALIAKGLHWTSNLAGKTRAEVNFQDIIANIPSAGESMSSNTFTLTVDDAVPITQTSNTLELKVNVNAPVFGMAMTTADGWARHATLRGTVTDGNPSRLRYQYNDNGTWTDLALTPTVTEQEATARWEGLTPTNNYEVRAIYGTHVSAPFTFTTEPELQAGNSGFEDWNLYRMDTWPSDIPFYEPWSNGSNDKWWNTTNDITTSSHPSIATYGYTTFPSVSYVAGNGSARAAEIRTTGWGGGSTYAGGASIVKNRTAGKLYLWDGNEEGHPFVSRPLSMTFAYKYAPYGTDEFEAYIEVQHRSGGATTVLGSGSFRSNASVTDFASANVPITYTREDLQATHIYIHFVSTTSDSPATQPVQINLTDGDSNWKTHTGSILTVDDLNLAY